MTEIFDPSHTNPSPEGVGPSKNAAVPLDASEEHTLALLAHLSVLLNLFTGWLGLIPPFIIYLAYKDRSRYVAFQSLQALIFQLIFFFASGLLVGVAWAITGVLSLVVVGLCLVPFALLISLAPLASCVYGIVAAVKTNNGEDFKYWLVGNWAKDLIK